MSTALEQKPAASGSSPGGAEDDGPVLGPSEHGHPSDLQYIWVALALAVVTGVEIWLSEMDALGDSKAYILIALAVLKFWAVAAYFMHLKFDHRNFRTLFLTGIGLALFCYLVVLFASHQLRF